MGKKHYSDAIDCYTRAINQKALSDSENSIIFANRAHVNLQLGNYRRALLDAEEAIKLSPSYAKVDILCFMFILSNLSFKFEGYLISPAAGQRSSDMIMFVIF